jgi:sucrose-phosphate synthase
MITINNFDYFSKKIINRVKEKYTWKKTAEGYLKIIEKSFLPMSKIDENISELNAEFLIKNYLRRAIP